MKTGSLYQNRTSRAVITGLRILTTNHEDRSPEPTSLRHHIGTSMCRHNSTHQIQNTVAISGFQNLNSNLTQAKRYTRLIRKIPATAKHPKFKYAEIHSITGTTANHNSNSNNNKQHTNFSSLLSLYLHQSPIQTHPHTPPPLPGSTS
ncbi:hypothetical protein FG476_07545 [Xylella fastidiosa subsp. multiplex]|uniref:Uncharacterized protein n=1 Tax=Xylella fastidiosa subsp. multiplex TaxID=644357 RepID=A0A9Q4QSV0_XYLFS|nr:conserved hypothetical protein [Xylella fastidiosa M12]MBE0268130.1 hypothetical protein [Xylella fastidiosa subsp. multiplex]TNV90454.1 hypothetical protein C5H23_02430 [Xylella fastidiosa]MBE0274629.1 hypothetical protein [Xylella fastidiosa subsp. multiplex]MBE0276932.1 hypothetical protein [Xylella fastidiosa subsp. multiplex]